MSFLACLLNSFLYVYVCAFQVGPPDLAVKLGDPVDSGQVLGPVSSFMSERYGFERDTCLVIPFTGDNPRYVPKPSPAREREGASSASG